jgi:hypothetical protein
MTILTRAYLTASIVILCSGAAFAPPPVLPDPSRTPGVSDDTVTEANYRTQLCRGTNGKKLHTTDEKRPSTAYTNKLKKKQLAEWSGYSNKKLSAYEEDHLISLELGGSDSDTGNLWPEFWDTGKSPYKATWGAHVKDGLETELGRRICLADDNPEHLSLTDARIAISGDWVKAYKDYVCTRTPKLTAIMKAHCPAN